MNFNILLLYYTVIKQYVMTKEFSTITGVSKYMKHFGETLSLINDSYMVEYDLTFDSTIVKEWAKNKDYEYMPFISYIRLRGTFTNYGSNNVNEDKKCWKDQIVGQLKVFKNKDRKFVVEFINNWD